MCCCIYFGADSRFASSPWETVLLCNDVTHWQDANLESAIFIREFKTYITCFKPSYIWGCMCSTGPFQYRWLKRFIYSSCYYHHQIGSIHLSYCYHIFCGCVSEMFVTSYSVTYCIYIPGKPWICFHSYCAVYDAFCLEDRIRLFVHYTISLSSLCKLIWRHWTCKMPVRYILSSVWVI